eukprot:449414_1
MFFISLEYLIATSAILITIILSFHYFIKKKDNTIVSHDGIKTKIISDTQSCITAINDLKKLNPYILGLDCEWVGKHKVSLLQLGHSKLILLIRIHKLKTIPIELIGVMNDTKILKTGVGIYQDVKKLRNDYSINVNGVVDINNILPLITNFNELLNNYYQNTPTIYTNGEIFGLNRLSQIMFGEKMKYKHKIITISNWEINSLTPQQISYAADDAIIGWKLFKKCMELENISHDIEKYLTFCFGRIDIPMSIKPHKIKIKNISKPSAKTMQQMLKRDERKIENDAKHRTKMFDGCKLLKPNGSLFIGCSDKSMKWYLKKGYAEIIDEKTAKLKHEPKIKNEKSLSYFKNEGLKNQCFVCGKKGKLCQFDIMPKQYRVFMDESYKSKALCLHDHIPLCTFCHPIALGRRNILIEELCEKYNDKIPYYKVKKGNKEHKLLCGAQRAAKALQKKKRNNNIPIKNKIKLLSKLCDYFGFKYDIIYCEDDEMKHNDVNVSFDKLIKIESDDIAIDKTTTCIINECIEKVEMKSEEESSKSKWELHAKAMLEIYKDKQIEFIEMWRRHFKENMKPQYLPDAWSVSTSNMLNHDEDKPEI